MFREEMSDRSEPQRPPHKPTPWTLILLVVLLGLVAAHAAGLTKPLRTMALQLYQGGSRNLLTPASRLVGRWESDDDPMFRRVCYIVPRRPDSGAGIYLADGGNGMREVMYRILSQDGAGTSLLMAEYLPGADGNYQVQYSVAKDGRSMTREYEVRKGSRVSSRYRYLGPPTESLP